MAVPCPRCGREYDLTLFEFGRTLWCTCGSRVGLAPRQRRAAGSGRRFIADAMLGRLARWLRLLGFDCAWEHDIADEVLIRRATAEGRIVLSRDRALTEEWRISGIHWVDAEKVREQLSEVVRAFALLRTSGCCRAAATAMRRSRPPRSGTSSTASHREASSATTSSRPVRRACAFLLGGHPHGPDQALRRRAAGPALRNAARTR